MPLSDLEQQIFMPILKREGGWVYTNNPADAGGQTYGGCTLTTLNDWRAGGAVAGGSDAHGLRAAWLGPGTPA